MRGRKPGAIIASASALENMKPPAWLSKDSKAEWKRVMPDVSARKILTSADLACLENFCVAVGRVRELERLIQAAGFDAAMVRAQDKAIQTARQLAAELGLTPVSRSRPAIRQEAEHDLDFLD